MPPEESASELERIFEDYSTLPEYLGVQLDNVNTKSSFGDFPLHVACTRGELSDVKILLEYGADLNVKGEYGFTPLHQAVQHGQLDIVKFLIDRGACADQKSDDGDTPLDLADILGEMKIKEFLQNLDKMRKNSN